MGKIRAAITGVHGWVPETRLTNADLEKMVDTNDEWIISRTGIKERRILKTEGWATSDMCAEAVKGLLEKTGTKPGEIDLIIVATVTADMVFPDTANTVCDKVGAKNAFGFDINAACSGFLFALSTGAQFVQNETYSKVIVVGSDMMSSIIDYQDRNTCIIFGDGAGAVLLEPRKDGNGIMDFTFRQLEIFRAVVVSGSITKASHRIGLSQPSISQQLAKLEDSLGVQLVNRNRTGSVSLTPAGDFWYRAAQDLTE